MIPLAGNWIKTYKGELVNLDNIVEIDVVAVSMAAKEKGGPYEVRALWLTDQVKVLGWSTLLEADTRDACRLYVSVLFDLLAARSSAPALPQKGRLP